MRTAPLIKKYEKMAYNIFHIKIRKAMKVNYSKTLGEDRLFQDYYLYKKFIPKYKKIYQVDIGTFLTIDLITTNGFKGVHIFPGPNTYLQSYNKGAALPIISSTKIGKNINNELSNSTKKAIQMAFLVYMKSVYQQVIKKPQHVILTGRQGKHSLALLKNFCPYKTITHKKHLIHHALFYLLKEEI